MSQIIIRWHGGGTECGVTLGVVQGPAAGSSCGQENACKLYMVSVIREDRSDAMNKAMLSEENTR